jgi:hypothetical protein
MFSALSTPRKWSAGLLAAAVLTSVAVLAGLGLAHSRQAPSAPAFSLERALHDVAVLAAAPRPIGSAANGAARAHIVAQLTALGLAPQVQTALAQKNTIDRRRNLQVALGMVNNVVVLIPGVAPDHASRPALLLASAYDTGERSVGAAASAAPVAALLETLRRLAAMAPMANDVVVLFADGESVGGLGARAFAGQHRLAPRIGLAIRFDSAGSAGAPVLVGVGGTTAASAAAVRGWASAAPRAHGGAALQGLYQDLPGVHMGDLAKLGSAHLHLANLEGGNGSGIGSRDTVDRLAPAMLEQAGATMFALARHFGDGPALTAARPGQAQAPVLYFDLPLAGVISYSQESVWAFTRLACLLLAIVCCLAVQRGEVSVREMVDAALGFVAIAAVLVLAAALVWNLLPSLHRGYDAHNAGAGLRDSWFLGGFAALGTALFVLLQRGFRRAVGHAAAALGPLLAAGVLLLVLSWQMPQTSYVLAWPLIGTLLAYGVLYAPQLTRLSGLRRALILGAGAVPALLIIGPLLGDVFIVTSPERSELPMIVLALLLGMASVLLTAQRRFIVRGLGVASLACFTVAGSAAPYGQAPLPQPNRMVYLKDAATWKSWWMMPNGPLDPWSRGFFPAAGARARVQVEAFGWNSSPMWLAPAPRSEVTFPAMLTVSDVDDGQRRHLRFTLAAKAAVPFIDLTLSGADAFATSVNGRPLSHERSASYTLALYGMGGQTLDFRFDVESDKQAIIEVLERTPGLPVQGAERPAGLPPPFTPMTATTIARDRLIFR